MQRKGWVRDGADELRSNQRLLVVPTGVFPVSTGVFPDTPGRDPFFSQ